TKPTPEHELRRKLEAFHGHKDPKAVETAWPHLDSSDRYVRFAARVAIEFQDPATWRDKALAETRPTAAINALLALVRVTAQDPFHHPKKDGQPDDSKPRAEIIAALDKLDFAKLEEGQKLEMLRVYGVLFNRMGKPDDAERKKVLARLDGHFPARERLVN